MSKKSLILLAGLLTVAVTAGCGSISFGEQTTEDSSDKVITGYLVENADSYVTLGDYDGLEVERPIYTVSDEEVDMEVENRLYDNYQYLDVERPSQDGDVLTADITATIEGESAPTFSETDYTLDLGYGELGSDVDEQLMDCNVGDHKTFSVTFDDDAWYEEWIGKTGNFDITITNIQEVIVPEYDDSFVETLGFDSKDAFEKSIREDLEKTYAEQSTYDTRENVLLAAMENCEFNGYPDKLYDYCAESLRERYRSFAEAFGMSEEEFYEASDMTDEDLEDEILEDINRKLFVSALCNAENIQITESDYTAYVEEQYVLWQYETTEDFVQDYGKEYLLWNIYEEKAADLLLSKADITDVLTAMDDDWDLDEDDGDDDDYDIEFVDGDDLDIEFDEDEDDFEIEYDEDETDKTDDELYDNLGIFYDFLDDFSEDEN